MFFVITMKMQIIVATVVSLLLALPSFAAPAEPLVPFALPYNADMVREPGGALSAGIDGAGRGLVSAADAVAHGAVDSSGLPEAQLPRLQLRVASARMPALD